MQTPGPSEPCLARELSLQRGGGGSLAGPGPGSHAPAGGYSPSVRSGGPASSFRRSEVSFAARRGQEAGFLMACRTLFPRPEGKTDQLTGGASKRVAIPPASAQRLLRNAAPPAPPHKSSDVPPCEECKKSPGAGICCSCNLFLCDACCLGAGLRSGGFSCDNCGLMLCKQCAHAPASAAGNGGPAAAAAPPRWVELLNLQDCSGCRAMFQAQLHRQLLEQAGQPQAPVEPLRVASGTLAR